MDEERLAKKRASSRAWAAAKKAQDPAAWREKDRLKQRARRAKYGDKVRAMERAHYAKNRVEIRKKTAEWYAKNINGIRDKARAYHHKQYLNGRIAYRMQKAFNAARHRAAKRGLDFDLKIADLGLPTHCAVTGIEFQMTGSFRDGNIFVPSLDRIDPNKGYVVGNVRVVVHGYNLAKHTGTDENVIKLARAIVAMADGKNERLLRD